jgi:hypothetical protein
MHGGAKGSGAPKGKANGAYKHGGFTAAAVDLRREVGALLKRLREGKPDETRSGKTAAADRQF